LTESIIKPNAKISQGFETQWFKLKADEDEIIEGFVTREAGNELELRNAAGVAQIIKTADILRRGKRETSIMPEGLVNTLTPQELADMLEYLGSLKK
jgi:putative heme-binding domain-containing protein